jgi:hypothetical protein
VAETTKRKTKNVDGVFYEYLPQTFTPPVSDFLVQVEQRNPGISRKILTYLVVSAVILAIQIAVFYLLLRSAGQL